MGDSNSRRGSSCFSGSLDRRGRSVGAGGLQRGSLSRQSEDREEKIRGCSAAEVLRLFLVAIPNSAASESTRMSLIRQAWPICVPSFDLASFAPPSAQ